MARIDWKIIETIASPTRTNTVDDVEDFVKELREEKIPELSMFIEDLGKSRLNEILENETD